MKPISTPTIPSPEFYRIKTDFVEFAFNFFLDGVSDNVSARTFKLRFFSGGIMILQKDSATNSSGRITFALTTAEKPLVKDNARVILVEIKADLTEKTLVIGELIWGVKGGRNVGLQDPAEISINYKTATQEILVSLGIVDLGSSSAANSAAIAGEYVQQALAVKNGVDQKFNAIETTHVQILNNLSTSNNILQENQNILSQTTALKVAAENAVANAALGQNPLGEYNASTNTPSLLNTPPSESPAGSYYDITVQGTAAFSGSNFTSGQTLEVGGRIIKKNTSQWYYTPPNNLALSRTIAIEANMGGEVEDGESRTVSGDKVYKALPTFSQIRTSQLFDINNYEKNLSFNSVNGNSSLLGAGTTKYINIPVAETTLSYSGLGSSIARRIAWMNGDNGTGSLVIVTTVADPSKTVAIPAGAKSFRFFFQRPEDGDVTGTFMLNFGSSLPWEPYAYIRAVNNYPLAEPDPAADGQILEGEERPVSGDRVYKALPSLNQIRTSQLFDINNYDKNLSFGSTNGNTSLPGAGTTKYINIPVAETTLSYSGLGSSIARRIAWMDGDNGTGSLVIVTTVADPSKTVAIPAGAKSFRFFFQRPEDGDVTGTFMLNFGSSLPWEPYAYIEGINSFPLYTPPPKHINNIYAELSGVSPVVNESGWYRCCPVVEDVAMKGCTGYAFDFKRNLHVVSEYNTTISSRLLIFRPSDLVDRNVVSPVISPPHKTIDISSHLDHIQGCAWDWVDDTYLALGTLKGMPTSSTNSVVVKVSPAGTIIDIITLGDNLALQVGMIDILSDGSIGIKPNTGTSLYIFNRAYQLLNRVALINNEGFCVNKFTGDVWCASDAFQVKKYDKNFQEKSTFAYNTFPNGSGGSNVEGMAIMTDGSLVICADAFLHGGTALGNALYFFDFENTVNKRRYFYLPNGSGNPAEAYTSEILSTPENVTEVIIACNYDAKKQYRSGATKADTANASFSNSLNNSSYLQVKIS